MHPIEIPAAALERIGGVRAERPMFPTPDPRRTALVVVDMQNGFLEPGAPVEVPVAREIVPAINRLAQALRAAGGTVFWLRFRTDARALASWTSFYRHMFDAPHREAMQAAFGPGCHHGELWPELDLRPEDRVLDKTRYSAFVPGTCNLHDELQAAGIDTLIVTGTLSNCCCESTTRDAMQRDYRVFFASDANATLSDAEHTATLGNMAMLFAEVLPTDAILATIDLATARAA